MRSSAGNSLAAWLFRGNHGPFEHFRCIPLYLPCPDRTICSGATLIKKTRANWSAEKRFKLDMVMWCFASWWFGSFFILHNIWDNPSHWLSYFSRWVKPPTSLSCLYVRFTGCNSDTPVPTSLGTSQTSFRTRRTSQPSLPYVLENILAEALENQKYGTNLQAQMFFFYSQANGVYSWENHQWGDFPEGTLPSLVASARWGDNHLCGRRKGDAMGMWL